MKIDNVTAKFTEDQLRDAFMCGVVVGRMDKSPVEIDNEEERCKVEDEYGPFWPGELLLGGFFEELDGPVSKLEHASYMEHHKTAQLTKIQVTGDCAPTTLWVAGSLPIGKGDPQ